MKMNLKRRLSVFLCLLLAVPTLVGAVPQAKLEAQAASSEVVVYSRMYNSDKSEVQITKKTKGFYAGDLFSAYKRKISGNYYYTEKNYGYLSLNSGVTYKSSEPAVASVNKTSGLIKPKKKGSTKITVKFKGVSASFNLKVVSSLGKTSTSKRLEKASDKMIKAYGKKINNKNRYLVTNAYNQYTEEMAGAYKNTKIKMSLQSGMESSYDAKDQAYTYKVHSPLFLHASSVANVVSTYKAQRNPVGTGQAKLFNVTSVSVVSDNVVSAKLKKKVTADQIYGLKAAASALWDTKISEGTTAEFPLYIKDTKTGYKYYAVATATEGTNTLSIQLRSRKLYKGNYYRLQGYGRGDFTQDWTNQGNTKFKVK